jgi:ABC-2 type transport system ATP-binding protein
MEPVIEAAGLTKRFGRTTALDRLDVVAQAGQVLAVLGPNGAGKTTFVRVLATLLRPDGGELRVAGRDARRDPGGVRSMIGLAGQYAAVEPTMTGQENLEMVARLFGQSRRQARASATRVLGQTGLTEVAGKLARTYSGGMRRRLDLGASLVGAPRLLLLDEPTTGLDPRSRIELWDAIRGLAGQGTDVLLTTQYLDEADQLADNIVIIDHGRAIAAGPPADLKQRLGRSVLEVHVRYHASLPAVAAVLARLDHGRPHVAEATRTVTATVAADAGQLAAGLRALEAAGVSTADISFRPPSLDEVFLELTAHPAAPAAPRRGPAERSKETP